MSTTEKQRLTAILFKLCELRDKEALPNGFFSDLSRNYAASNGVLDIPNNVNVWLQTAKARNDAGRDLTTKDVTLINLAEGILANAAEKAKNNTDIWGN
jgi:hypothetical protein